ncbi:MAG TPA: DUF4124 domain-containing protein [Casimicrobiaceae bacterium]
MWCTRALAWCFATLFIVSATAATLAEKARESGCVNKPVVVEGSTYKCYTQSGAFSYFNVPNNEGRAASEPPSKRAPPTNTASAPPSSGFPRVDAATQRSRDDLRRKVLGDELATEERLLTEAKAAYGNGSPAPLPEEKADIEKYRQRVERLRQAVELHERNIEALRKELGNTK